MKRKKKDLSDDIFDEMFRRINEGVEVYVLGMLAESCLVEDYLETFAKDIERDFDGRV